MSEKPASEIAEKYDEADHTPSGDGEVKESAFGPMIQQSVRLPEDAIETLKHEGKKIGLGKSTMMRRAIMEWIRNNLESESDSDQTIKPTGS